MQVRPVVDIMNKFSDYFKPGKELSIDEAMIKFKGRHFIKQYMPNKPDKWGIKVYYIADAKTGYLLKGNIYLGKKESTNKDFLLGEQVVLNLAKEYENQYHHIFFDNFFSSVNLLSILLEKKTYACGTIRANRKEWPESFKKPKTLKLKQGEYKQLQSGEITATLWHDKRDVQIISSNCDASIIKNVPRTASKNYNEKINIPCPLPIIQYNNNMGGVDLLDQKRSYYGIGRSSRKWWKYIFKFVMNVAIINSHILYDLSNKPSKPKQNTQLNFRINLIKQLIGDHSSFKRSLTQFKRFSTHLLHNIRKTKYHRICVFCKKNKVLTYLGYTPVSSFQCQQCGVFLCKNNCFNSYHKD